MTITTLITFILIYLLIGYFLSTAFQEEGQNSLTSVILYPLTLTVLCILTFIFLLFDAFRDTESEYMA